MKRKVRLKPLVSVIVPVYNVQNYLKECVESIRNQTYTNLEILLIDDGSTDKSGAMCDAYSREDERIQVIHKKNGGLSDARNAGLDVCKGEYIGFVDSDDVIAADMYEKLLQASVLNNADISACHSARLINGKIRHPRCGKELICQNRSAIIKRIFLGWGGLSVSACIKLYKRNVFKDVRFPYGKTNEDVFVILDICEHASRMVVLPEPLYYYRMRLGSITRKKKYHSRLWDTVEGYQQHLKRIAKDYPALISVAEVRLCWAYRVDFGYAGDTEDWRQHWNEIREKRRVFRRHIIRFLKNPWISGRGKVDAFMAAFFPFSLYVKIRRKMADR